MGKHPLEKWVNNGMCELLNLIAIRFHTRTCKECLTKYMEILKHVDEQISTAKVRDKIQKTTN